MANAAAAGYPEAAALLYIVGQKRTVLTLRTRSKVLPTPPLQRSSSCREQVGRQPDFAHYLVISSGAHRLLGAPPLQRLQIGCRPTSRGIVVISSAAVVHELLDPT